MTKEDRLVAVDCGNCGQLSHDFPFEPRDKDDHFDDLKLVA